MAALDISADRVEKIACRKCGRHLDVSGLEPFSKVKCPDCGTKQTVPMLFGNFLLLELQGKGGMGAVYKALDQSLGRYVAIKVMQKKYGEDIQFKENFFREARAAAALNHPNVVQIYSCGEEHGQPYIVMELVGGGRLDEMISDGNPIEEVRALEIAVDIAEGLKAANEIGLIHGDIKPANILFDMQNTAKVVDFGLARFISWQSEKGGEIWGTPYYIAPEKARGQRVDHRSDIYSLGATLYHALGAKPPFDGKTATDVVLARLKNPAIGLRVIRPSLQPETADLIARMLEADPFMRYPTYASLLADIREALRVAKQEKRSVHHKVKKSRAGPLIVIGIGVLACLVLVIGALQASRSSKKNKQAETEIIQPEEPVDSEEVAAATEPEVHATPELPETVSPVVEPFTRNGAKILMAAANFMNEGKTMASEEQLQVLYDHMRPRTMGRYWVRMLQAMGCWNDGRSRDARVYLREIMEAPFETEDPDQSHPGDYLHAAARHLTGSEDEGKLYIEAARWAPWYKDFAELIVGINYLNRGKTGQAETHLQHYVNSTPQGKQWPYSLQPLARTLLEQQADWRNISEQIEVAIEKRKSREALETLEEFRDRSSVIFAPLINAKRQRVEVEIQRRMEEQRRAEMLAHIKQVQQDLDMLDEVRTQNLPFLAQRDYRKAAAATSRMLPRMETPEGQDSMRVLQDSYERLNDYKRFIIDAVNRSPFEGSSELGGTAVKANLTGIKVSLYGHGAMLKPWDQISTRLMVQMGHRYIKEQDMSSEEQADMMLSLALLCYYSSAFNPAEKYAEEAINMNPSIKVTVRRFMPDVVPN